MQKNCFLFAISGKNKEFFKRGLLVTLKSLRVSNPGIPIVICYDHLTARQKLKLKDCRLIKAKPVDFEFKRQNELTKAIFFRFYLDILDGFDKVLYLDSDLVVLDDLSEVFQIKGNLIACGKRLELSHDFKDVDEIKSNENIKEGDLLLNSGVICFDRKFWVQKDIRGRMLEIAEQYGIDSFNNPDQAILNILASRNGGFTYLSNRYNYCRWNDMEENQSYKIKVNPKGIKAPFVDGRFIKILHWNGNVKPWHLRALISNQKKRKKYFYECYQQFVGSLIKLWAGAIIAKAKMKLKTQ